MTINLMPSLILIIVAIALSACTPVPPWQRGILAKPSMAIAPTPMQDTLSEHTHSSREAASASSSSSGGGCGCY